MTLALASLNDSQRVAVEWDGGPLLVLAGPGSGKTRVLTFRIVRFIEQTPGARFRILGVTFTNRAASEMRNRIDALVSEGRERALLTTFHSFAADVLRQHGTHVGLKPDFTILSQIADRQAILSDSIKAAQRVNEEFDPTAEQLLPAIDRLLDECVSPDQALRWLGGHPQSNDVAAIYREYRGRLIEANQMDFGLLLALAVELLEQKPAIAKQIQRTYTAVCVDEFQDTNAAQYRFLVQLVPATNANLFVVADDDQIIYQWNGANPQRLVELRRRFAMQVVQLPENYRCPPEVITLANNLIRHNEDRAPDKQELSARKASDGQSRVTVQEFAELQDELSWISERIGRLPKETQAQCVILARTRRLLEKAVEALTAKGIPSYIATRKNEFESAPLRWLHAMLRLANARQDREQLRRVCKAFFPLEGIELRVEDIVARAALESGDYLRALVATASERQELETETRGLLEHTAATLLDRLDHWAFARRAVEWLVTVQSRGAAVPEGTFDEFEEELETWRMLENEIIEGMQPSDLPLHRFLQELDLRSKDRPVPAGAVRCLTIHASKGMEFKHVFLMGLVEDQLPSWAAVKKGSNSHEMREERRNCFVAITRAEETLALTYSTRYFGFPKDPSRFLTEMGAKLSPGSDPHKA